MSKRSLYLSVFVLMMSYAVHAQFYLKANGGYGLPMSTSPIGTNAKMTYDGNTYKTVSSQVTGSYGAGISASVGGGYMFSPYVGFELGAKVLQGRTQKLHSTYDDTSDVAAHSDYHSDLASKGILVSPSIVFTTNRGNVVPYTRLGFVTGSVKVITKSSYTSTGGDANDSYGSSTTEQRKGMPFGFSCAIGVNWLLNNSLKLFGELDFTSLNYSPGESVMTKSSQDGVNNLASLSEFSKHTVYKKIIETSGTFDGTKPRQSEKISMAMSACTVHVGIAYVFGGIKIE